MAVITRTSAQDYESLRRAAASAEQGPTAEQQAMSYPRGANVFAGHGEAHDPTSVSFPFLRLMRRDHVVAMGLHFIAMPIIKVPWYYSCDDVQVSSFADNVLRPIYGSLVLSILRMLWAGYSPGAKSFEVVNPTWTYLENEEVKPVWDQGAIGAMVYKPVTQLRPESCMPSFDASGAWSGIQYDKRYGQGAFVINGRSTPDIDLLHSFWATHDMEAEDGSVWGYPRIAHCAPIFHMYRYIWNLLGRGFENNADPGPVVRYPSSSVAPPVVDSTGKVVNNVDVALRIGRRRRSGSTIALPSDVYTDNMDKPTGVKMWDIEYPKSETSFTDIQSFLGFLESAKLRALWLQEQGIIEGSGGASNRNVASEFGDQRNASQIILAQQIDQVIDDQFMKPIIAMNFPQFQGTLTKKNIGYGSSEEDVVRQILQLYGQGDYTKFGVDVRRLLDSTGMPMLTPTEYAEQQKRAAEQAALAPTPAVEPTQGRRALVTQTGFDRDTQQPIMSYNQLGDVIYLSDDSQFVDGLPKTDVFADQHVVTSARKLRTLSKVFLSWIYTDFSVYLGKQKTLDLEQLIREIAQEHFDETGVELADGDKIRKAVNRIMVGWKPKVDKLSDFNTKTRVALGQIFERATGIQLERVGSTAKLSATDKAAAAWLDARGAEMVSGVLETTRTQLSSVLADGVRAGKTPKEIAQDIREHFEGFPEARANMIARTETASAFNYATASAGIKAGVRKAQLIDGTDDDACKKRNGKIVNLTDAIKEKLYHPNCTLYIRLLPGATQEFDVRIEPLEGYMARFDIETQTVLFHPDLPETDRVAYLIAVGEKLSVVPGLDSEPVAA